MLIQTDPAWARSESELKAAYLYNFIKFISWPEETEDEPFHLCLFGEAPFGPATQRLATLKIRTRSIQLVQISEEDQYATCDAAYFTESAIAVHVDALTYFSQLPVLTVSDAPGFANKRGIIGFVKQGNVVRFNINLKRARATGLKISAKLLKLANQVIQ